MTRFTQVALALAVLGAMAFPAQAAQRVFVASYGSDANAGAGCLLNAPCRSFTAAHSAVDAGGEIVALDAAGYGAVTITKSVTITANPGYFAGIAASSGVAVSIATPGVNVTLRGLNLNGIGGAYGVVMTDGDRLTIENCVISSFGADGVYVSTAVALRVMDSTIRDNVGNGIYVTSGATASINNTRFLGNQNMSVYNHGAPIGTTTTVAIVDSVMMNNFAGAFTSAIDGAFSHTSITRTTASNNVYGFAAEGSANSITTVSYSMATGNTAYGLYQTETAIMESQGNNTARNNGVGNTFGTITAAAGI